MTESVKIAVNPVIYADMPDPDVIRVENTFYMISTTMHFMPGAVILRSYNLADWEIAGHVYDVLDDYPAARMQNGKNIYGSGMWAASLKYYNGKFYVLHIANDTHSSYLYTAEKPEGPWSQKKIKSFFYDPGLFFDDDGRVYVVHGNREIRITELDENLNGSKSGGLDKVILKDRDEVPLGYEGSHLYKINGKYVLCLIHWPKEKMRTQAVFTADKLDGEWKGGDVLCDDMGEFHSGVAQGGLVDTLDGDWYAVLFQDHGAQGRMPCIVSVTWDNGKPVYGQKGKALKKMEVKDYNPGYKYAPISDSDDFNYEEKNPKLKNVWEWNHIPEKENWWIENNGKKAGSLCIRTNYIKQNLVTVQNTLTQRLVGMEPKASVFVNALDLNDGDVIGLAAFESCYAFVGLKKKNGKVYVVRGETNYPDGKIEPNRNNRNEDKITDEIEITGNECQLKLNFDFKNLKDEVRFFWRETEMDSWKEIGKAHKLRFMLDHFCGTRAALFVYSENEAGGIGRFNKFRVE
ncbi:MAG: family 43 glycosylhydrolase [Treponema sp.]|nr:family 43 glycosylhydrolase [Treponema sp.]